MTYLYRNSMEEYKKTYRVQDGCWSCNHVFECEEYESETIYYCTFQAPKRPQCGSVFLREIWNMVDLDEFDKEADKWDVWAEPRRVKHCGICANWKEHQY